MVTLYSGTETKVNTLFDSMNFFPVVEALAGGGFVFAFNNTNYSIYTRRYDQDGVAIDTSEVSIGLTVGTPTQTLSNVTGLSTGGFLLAWTTNAGGSSTLVTSMSFNADGTADLAAFTASSGGTAGRGFASVEALSGGGWVSAYGCIANNDDGNGNSYRIAIERFDADGVSQTLNGTSTGLLINVGSGTAPAVDLAVLANGDWVVTWQTYNTTGSTFDIHQRIINSDGTFQTDESIVNITTTGTQLDADVTALTDGGYVICWSSDNGDGTGQNAFMQVYDADGTARTNADIQINTATTAGTQSMPTVTALSNGAWVVTWFSPDATNQGIYQKVYAADGSVLIDETRVNSNEFGDQRNLTVTTLENGDWVVGWRTADLSTGDSSVHFRTFGLIGTAPSGQDKTVTIREDRSTPLSANYFGFSDDEGDALAGVVITSLPGKGRLLLNGVAVTAGQTVLVEDFDQLVYKPPADQFGTGLASFGFKIIDSGSARHGSANTDATANFVTFNVTDTVDVFRGSAKANTITGTQGRDTLLGLGGNDKLRGLAGIDTFTFRTGDDKDTILDFVATGTGHDILDVSNWTAIANFNDLKKNHMTTVGNDVLISDGTDSILLKGVKIGDLDAGDFVF